MHSKFHSFRPLLVCACASISAATALSQGLPVTLWSQNGPSSNGDNFGSALRGLGDLDGDGRSDWIVGQPGTTVLGQNQAGRAVVFSATGATLFTFSGAAAFERFGTEVSDAGDQTGDGKSEILVSAPNNGNFQGRVLLFNGATGAPITQFQGPTANMQWGVTMCSLGDVVNNDGKSEYAFNGDVVGTPAVLVIDGANNQLAYTQIQPGAGVIDIANAGDANGDGKNDLLVATTASVKVFSGANGALLLTLSGVIASSVAGVSDADGDGIPEIAVGNNGVGPLGGQQGKISVFSGSNGALIWSKFGDAGQDELGVSVTGLGDVNSDGIGDLAAGAPQRTPGFLGLGYVRIYSGIDGCEFAEYQGTQLQSSFGAAVGDAGDADFDGRRDLMIGDPKFDAGFLDNGLATVKKSQLAGASVGTAFCSCTTPGLSGCGNNSTGLGGCLNSTGQAGVLLGFGSDSLSTDDLFLVASGLPASVPVLFFSGTQKQNGGFGSVLNDGLLCVTGTIKRLPGAHASNGVAVVGPCQIASAGYLAGQTQHFQAHYRNVTGPCATGSNMTNALEIVFMP